ncbi:MAG: 3-deoxy-7-phosphoheptulonate synthase [Candidatus Verstraetearchaeota archaeon]|nr:3-deoxy-7-phosphoheptulonate synthase [Candidatus Verstraetearchaeota archaeon]
MIIVLEEESKALEEGLGGRYRKVKVGRQVAYVVSRTIPKHISERLFGARIVETSKGYQLASREFSREGSKVRIGKAEFGGRAVQVCAGPCAVEGKEQLYEAARAVKEAGATVLRGGAFKPRTSPYAFQGLGEDGLRMLREVSDVVGIPVLTEATSPEQVPLVAEYADAIQIGARNMQNFELLRAAGRSGKAVVLKRGISATIEEWLYAAEYLLLEGNWNVILCERGIRSFDSSTRNVFDLAGMALVKGLTHLPVIADPSHATGRRELVTPAARAAIAAGADGLIVEVHPRPDEALSDGPQSLDPQGFAIMMEEVSRIAKALGRE